MTLTNGLMIAAVLLSPLVALSVERWRRKENQQSALERDVLYDLIRARAATRGPQQVPVSAEIMERALNSIPIIFSKNKKIAQSFAEFQEASAGGTPAPIRDQRLVSLILTICRQLRYKEVEESTIKNVLFLGREP